MEWYWWPIAFGVAWCTFYALWNVFWILHNPDAYVPSFTGRRERKRRAAAKLAEVARRADQQNEWFVAGDLRGIYGEP